MLLLICISKINKDNCYKLIYRRRVKLKKKKCEREREISLIIEFKRIHAQLIYLPCCIFLFVLFLHNYLLTRFANFNYK